MNNVANPSKLKYVLSKDSSRWAFNRNQLVQLRPLTPSSNHWGTTAEAPLSENTAQLRPSECLLASSRLRKSEEQENQRAIKIIGMLIILALALTATNMNTFSNAHNRRLRFQDKNQVIMPQSPDLHLPLIVSSDALIIQAPEDNHFVTLEPLADLSDRKTISETPVFWVVPRCADEWMKEIMEQCFGLTIITEETINKRHQDKTALTNKMSLPHYQRVRGVGFVSSGLSNVIASSYLYEILPGLDASHKGRGFTMLRHPVDRAVSQYCHLRQTDPSMINVPLLDYARGQGIENNWMVRFLANRIDGDLERDALDLAKLVLRRKFLIGLLEEKEESIKRFQNYFGWEYSEDNQNLLGRQPFCISSIPTDGIDALSKEYFIPSKGSQEYALIFHQNQFDVKLFDYAKILFEEQKNEYGLKEQRMQGRH